MIPAPSLNEQRAEQQEKRPSIGGRASVAAPASGFFDHGFDVAPIGSRDARIRELR